MSKLVTGDPEKDIEVDKLHLDDECEAQASMYFLYAGNLALARGEADQAKNKLKAVEAERELYYRRSPPDGVKITEAVITALVNDDGAVKGARDVLQQKEAEVNALWAVVGAMDNRKSMLDNLTKLQVSSYYSSTSDASVKDARDRLNKEQN